MLVVGASFQSTLYDVGASFQSTLYDVGASFQSTLYDVGALSLSAPGTTGLLHKHRLSIRRNRIALFILYFLSFVNSYQISTPFPS